MTNLERAAAIAAERGWPLVERYRGWPVYAASGWLWSIHPHELSVEQYRLIGLSIWPYAETGNLNATSYLGVYSQDAHESIDDFEAAREAMPATAFFGVPEEVALL